MKKREEKASRRTREKLLICLRMCVYKKPQSETGNKRLREPHKTRSAKRTIGYKYCVDTSPTQQAVRLEGTSTT